jgi:RNA polymerase sigma factor (sigma-70 family)
MSTIQPDVEVGDFPGADPTTGPVGSASDADLMSRAAAGDSSAFAQLWHRHAPAARQAARRVTTSFDPDDLAQEAFTRTWSALRAGHGPKDAFRAYLGAAIRNIAATWARKAPASAPLDDDAPVDELTLADPTESALEHSLIVRAFQTLPDEWRSVLWYVDVEGLTATEVAPWLGLTPNSVASLTYRAREGLRRAWISAHLNSAGLGDGCRWTAERMPVYLRQGLPQTHKLRFESHVEECASCTVLLGELDDVALRLKAILIPLALGVPLLPPPPVALPASAVATTKATLTTTSTWAASVGVAAVLCLGLAADTTLADIDQSEAGPAADATIELTRPAPRYDTQPQPATLDEPARDQFFLAGNDPVTPRDLATPDQAESVTPDRAEPVQEPAAPVVAAAIVGQPVLEEPELAASTEPGPRSPDLPDREVVPTPRSSPSPPEVVGVTGAPYYLPEVTGRALPEATIEAVDVDTRETVGRTRADSTGAFSLTATLEAGRSTVVALRQTTPSGAASGLGDPLEPILLLAPSLQVQANDTPAGPVPGTALLRGDAGMFAEALVDGVATGALHVLDGEPVLRKLPQLGLGAHTLAVRYRDPVDGRVGAFFSIVVHVPDTVSVPGPTFEPL